MLDCVPTRSRLLELLPSRIERKTRRVPRRAFTSPVTLLKLFSTRSLRRRLGAVHPNHVRIARGMLSVGALLFGAKILAAGKEMVVAWRYGVGSEIDAYLLAITIVTWLPVMIVSVGTAVFVPRLVSLVPEPAQRLKFIAELGGTFLVLGLIATFLSMALGPWLVELVAGELPAETQRQTVSLVVQLAPLALFTVLAGLLAFRLQARESQGYTFLEAMPALGILVFVLFAAPGVETGPLVWGTLAGAILQVAWSIRMVRVADGGVGMLAFAHRSPAWRTIYAALGVMALGQFVMGFSTPIDQFYAARVGEGAVATLGYANRVISLAAGLGAVAIARALLPVLSDAAARGELRLGYAQAIRWSRLMLAAGGLVVVTGWLLAPWVVMALFERGAFAAQDSERVAQALRIGLFQLPFLFSGIVLVQWIVALGNYRFLLVAAVAAVASKVVLNELLTSRLGLDGVMYATAGMYAISWALQALFLWKTQTEAGPR